MTLATQPLSLTINGEAVGPVDIPVSMMMIDFLHEYLGLTGSRFGCGIGVCHACTLIVDTPDGSREVRSCITGAHDFAGKSIRTIEGLATRNAQNEVVEILPIQQRYLDHFSFQCGYCTPGFVIGATVFLERLKQQPIARSQVEAEVTRALDKHICRCTGYVRYFEAVRDLVLSEPGLTVEG